MRRLAILLAASLGIACSGASSVTETAATEPEAETPEPAQAADLEPSVEASPCDDVANPERFEVAEGGSFVSATGLIVRYLGESHDDFEDGRYDVSASMTYVISGEPVITRMPSLLAPPRYERISSAYCVQVQRGAGGVAVDVAAIDAEIAPTACAPAAHARLDSATPLTDGAAYYVDVFRDHTTGAWMPAIEPQTVVHRTPHMVWVNLEERPELSLVTGEWVRFEVELVSHVLEAEGSVSLFSGEYRLRIVRVCVP